MHKTVHSIVFFLIGIVGHVYVQLLLLVGKKKQPKSDNYQQEIAPSKHINQILYQDDLCYIIADVHPRSVFHHLTIPKRHVCSVHEVTPGDLPLLKHMRTVSRQFARDKGVDASLIFHVPPFYSIDHLHLHVIDLQRMTVSGLNRIPFYADTMWATRLDTVIEKLETKKAE